MARSNIPAHTNVKAALRDIISAHQAILDGIATHAEKHVAIIDARREEGRRQDAINAGIAKQSGQV